MRMVNSMFLMNDAELSSSAPLTNSMFMQCNVLHMAICLISRRKVDDRFGRSSNSKTIMDS